MTGSNPAESEREFERRFARVEGLLAQLAASADPLLERTTREILATVLELHQRGLARLLELAAGGERFQEALALDPRVSAMLLLHGLHPLALDTRISRALISLQQRFQSKLDDVTLDARPGVFVVRVIPAANACSSTRAALKKDFEEALLAAAPDAESVLVEFAEPAPALVKLRLRREATGEHAEGGRR